MEICVEPGCSFSPTNADHRCPRCKYPMHGICGTPAKLESFIQPHIRTPFRTPSGDVYAKTVPTQSAPSAPGVILLHRNPNHKIKKKPAPNRKRFSFAEKRNIVYALQRLTQLEAAGQFSVGLRTLSRIMKERDAILTAIASADSDKKSRRKKRCSVLEIRVLAFIRLARDKKMPVTEFFIRAAVQQEQLKLLENSGPFLSASAISFLQGFKGSRNWTHRFVKYNKLKGFRFHGQGCSLDVKSCQLRME